MSDIYSELYYCAGGAYDSCNGAPSYTDDGGSSPFKLTLWLNNHLGGGVGSVNCYDMGKAVVVFSNALGCGASYAFTYPFGYLNCIQPVGRGWTNNPFYLNPNWDPNPIVDGAWSENQGRSRFGNHAFARWNGTYIYDASAGIVDSCVPLDAEPCVEYSLDGLDSWNDSYRVRVIDDNPVSSPGTPSTYTVTVQ